MRRSTLNLFVLIVVCVALYAMPSNAGSVLPKTGLLDFSSRTSTKGGPVQHVGGVVEFTQGYGNSLTIVGAPIVQLKAPFGDKGPSKNGLYTVTDGVLDMTTGGCVMFCTSLTKGGFQSARFNAGGSLSIMGEITAMGITSVQNLIVGHFVDLGGSSPHASLNTAASKAHPSTGGFGGYLDITYINPDIVAALDLSHSVGEAIMTNLFLDLGFSDGTWTGTVGGSNVGVVPMTPTPEPTNLVLLGSALLAAGWVTRRKIKA
jgi:hypothetical protein